jgi:glutamate-1-semialdehyde 2,1-aminomutase
LLFSLPDYFWYTLTLSIDLKKICQRFCERSGQSPFSKSEVKMNKRDHTKLLADLANAYADHSPKSAALNQRAKKHLVDGGSHAIRLHDPFPPRITAARGAWLTDEDGHQILDLWQGHYANILGHNPPVITEALTVAFADGFGLQMGFTDRLQVEAAEILCRRTGAERVRFTTSGTLATMNAILLARTFTGRHLVMKVGGGWHGGHPWGLKGVGFHADRKRAFQQVDTEGLSDPVTNEVLVTAFNNPQKLEDYFRQYGDQIACFIVEPFAGAGGAIPATTEFLQAARELTQKYGAVLILDEVISGFRFRAGDAGHMYGIQPDLATFGKIIGGGMPVAAVGGQAEIMDLVGRAGGKRANFSGGTYSGHPASLLAANTMMQHLVENEAGIYPRLAKMGAKMRQAAEAAFAEAGIYVYCTGGESEALGGSSLSMLFFPYEEGRQLTTPEEAHNPAICDVALTDQVMPIAMLLEDVYVAHGLGAISAAHREEDVELLGHAFHRVAQKLRAHLK